MGLTSQLNKKYRHLISIGEYPVCYLCGQLITHQSEVSQDHIIPKSMGGQTREENLVPVHKICNSKKGCLTITEFFALKQREKT